MCLSTILDIITTVFLLLTLIVLIKYTIETTKLRKETVKHTELGMRPFVMLYDSALSGIKYKNSGQGIALNIEIKPFKYKDYTIAFGRETVLSSKEESALGLDWKITDNTGKSCPPKIVPITPYDLKSEKSNDVHSLEIRYENIEKKLYQTFAKISKKGIEFLEAKSLKA